MNDKNQNHSHYITEFEIMGAVLAIVISFGLVHNIWWAILHGMFGWTYVIYRMIVGY